MNQEPSTTTNNNQSHSMSRIFVVIFLTKDALCCCCVLLPTHFFFILANHFRVLYELLKVREVCNEKRFIYTCAFMGGLGLLIPSPFFLNYYIQDHFFLFQASIETILDLLHWKLFGFFLLLF